MKDLDVIDRKVPDPDGQYRLRQCRCGCGDVGYLKIRAGALTPWVVRCFGCGETGKAFPVRHDAQIYWNTNMAARPDNRRVIYNAKI